MNNIWRNLVWFCVAVLVCLGLWRLEVERASVVQSVLTTSQGQVTLYRADGQENGPLVVVTHGFAGSTQLMQTLSRDMARAGFTVAAFDFFGHGRNVTAMSADVSRIEGTTAQLIGQTVQIVQEVREQTAAKGAMALVGHSMATDIIVRAARDIPDVAALVAISMYSDAVEPSYPKSLLIVSGAYENHLRAIALNYARMVQPDAEEGTTVQTDTMQRRAVVAPRSGHLRVLFHPVTRDETRAWLASALQHPTINQSAKPNYWITLVLSGIVALTWPISRIFPQQTNSLAPIGPLRALGIAALASVCAAAAAVLLPGAWFGFSGFRGLMAFLLVWGIVAIVFQRDRLTLLAPLSFGGLVVLLFWGLGVFAIALDRYGAAFLPTGQRFPLTLGLALATIPFAIADRMLNHGCAFWLRLIMRGIVISALACVMIVTSGQLMLLFTVLPVLVLFFLAYGSMALALENRIGPLTSGIALGAILAWSIAASTPLFQS